MNLADVDVLVLGGGMAGVSLLARLAPRMRVALLEPEPALAYHTTGRSAAMFEPGYGVRAVHPLAAASAAFLRDPPDGFGGPLLSPRPILHLAGPGQLDQLIRRASPRARDRSLRWLTSEQAAELVPILRPQRIGAGILDIAGGDIDVARMHEGFLRSARVAGAKVFIGLGALQFERAGSGWRVRSVAGEFTAPVLVNATGAWADSTAKAAGARPLGLQPLSRTVVLLDRPAVQGFGRWPTVIDAAERFYFRPFAGRLLVTAADETPSAPCDAVADEVQAATAIARFAAACHHPVQAIARRWAGLRTFAADRTPLIGWDDETPGFFWHAGFGGVGIQAAPAASRLGAALIMGDPLPPSLAEHGVHPARFSPDRLRAHAAA